jgi:hypothetical protein
MIKWFARWSDRSSATHAISAPVPTQTGLPGSAPLAGPAPRHHDISTISRRLSARIAALREFPVTVSSAIDGAGTAAAPPLTQVLALAHRLATLRMLVDAGQYASDDPFVLQGLDPAAVALFEQLSNEEH